jgi:hypothetical protein
MENQGHYAYEKDAKGKILHMYGDTRLIHAFQSEGYRVDHLGWGDFIATKKDFSVEFRRYSDTKQMKDQVGRCHRLSLRGGKPREFVFPSSAIETEFSEDEEVYNKWKVDLK